jgi:P27 family predicted phage terminase small subunit
MRPGPAPQTERWPKAADALEKIPRAPDTLDKRGRKLWKELLGDLVPKGLVGKRDLLAIELALNAYELVLEGMDGLRYETQEDGTRRRRTLGEYLKGRNSQTSPELASLTKLLMTAKGYFAELGWTPASRARVVPVGKDKSRSTDPMEELLGEG